MQSAVPISRNCLRMPSRRPPGATHPPGRANSSAVPSFGASAVGRPGPAGPSGGPPLHMPEGRSNDLAELNGDPKSYGYKESGNIVTATPPTSGERAVKLGFHH